jgi:hypothetical protein
VTSWGPNDYGQRATSKSASPASVPDLDQIVFVEASRHSSAAISRDGDVWVWGKNEAGQLGLGHGHDTNVPMPISWVLDDDDTGFTEPRARSISISEHEHSLILLEDGRVAASGSNEFGQLGDGTTTDRSQFDLVPNLSSITQVVAGRGHSLALDEQGRIWAWGQNIHGELGLGDTESRLEPVLLTELPNVVHIEIAYLTSFALTEEGDVYGWGYNSRGLVGDLANADVLSPKLAQMCEPPPPIAQLSGKECPGTYTLDVSSVTPPFGDQATSFAETGIFSVYSTPKNAPAADPSDVLATRMCQAVPLVPTKEWVEIAMDGPTNRHIVAQTGDAQVTIEITECDTLIHVLDRSTCETSAFLSP